MSTFKLHLIGARTGAQIATHAALMRAHQEATAEAEKAGKAPPRPPVAPVLKFYGFSGRGVLIRMLDATERESVAAIAAKEGGEEATGIEFQQRRNRDWVLRALVEVTRERDLDEAGLAKATWVKVSQQTLEADGGAMSAKELFTPKDMDVLIGWFVENHLANAADLDAVSGKAVEVVDG